MNNNFQSGNVSGQLNQIEGIVQQLIQQTQQASAQYQQLLKQEQENAQLLQQLSQREQQAAQTIQTALQGHQTAVQQLQHITNLCNQISHTSATSGSIAANTQQQPYSNYGSSSYYRQ
ncbi:hypothetical protein D3P09_11705 [Paenibacillus pinisoli]|uniref:AMP-dependent synthetase and ligase n=1 Tax=Paenibacillus pinisoli TaxID=1276110 RepID=A0A3A6PXD4_9BACL|nr:hypothetical protein [Paenibacillus pinisoli]RJX40033.1 hypothetical protein D3P09_11705 [Paenibacillus pinisoli]